MTLRKFFCTFPQHLIGEPIVSHTLNMKFGVVPNIRAASITEQLALVAVEIEQERRSRPGEGRSFAFRGLSRVAEGHFGRRRPCWATIRALPGASRDSARGPGLLVGRLPSRP